MIRNTKQTIPFVQQQLEEAIHDIKAGDKEKNVVPKLEALVTHMQTLVTHDHLTGALNKVTLTERLEQELQRSKRTGHTFSLAMIEVDHLPDTMEKHGQEITKQILQIFTTQAHLVLRGLDSFGRYGSTEFAIVMPTTWIDQSLIAIERLRVKTNEVDWAQLAQGLNISFSSGVTSNAPSDTSEQILNRAMQGLSKAKAMGSGCVAQVDEPLPIFDV